MKAMKCRNWTLVAAAGFAGVALALNIVALSDSHFQHLRTLQSHQLSKFDASHPDLAISGDPELLRMAADDFVAHFHADHPPFPALIMTRSAEWGALEDKLSDYADHLRLMDSQSQELESEFDIRSDWTSLAATIFTVATVLLLVQARARRISSPAEPNPVSAAS